MYTFRLGIFLGYFLISHGIISQDIPTQKIIDIDHLSNYLKEDVKQDIANDGNISKASLAKYFREKFSERFFYDWRTVDSRFEKYNQTYNNQFLHVRRAQDHMQKYADSTQWVLPFNYLNGSEVNAYALRHLARQHKMVDISFQYFYSDKNPKYISYFTRQMRSLNKALQLGTYEKIEGGNGVYENFRSGYRVLNWMSIHNLFLGEKPYTDHDQLVTIVTLLQHGSYLYSINKGFVPGNHQTRGVSGLAMLSILLRDFKGTDQWYERSMARLGEHLTEEINIDGFQSERSVHYHMSDIGNYYYVYQLAKISDIPIGEAWEEKLQSLFTTLVKIAYPDKSAPVLQDDTDKPWAEKNDISGALTLGYLLFENNEMGYFANSHVDAKMFWYLNDSQLKMLENIETDNLEYKSLKFPSTGYYIMREGWNSNDYMMIISAGLNSKKPDHQHGDMLGVQAMANGKVILPNYQVRYYLKDLELFKNSMTKNVALVDDELQGRQYISNKGGSGFGKFKELPKPDVIAWETNDDLDLFVGSHSGFENIGVNYSRQVIYVKDDFWIVKDNFKSEKLHDYKQVWQGHYTLEHAPNLIRSSFDNGSGCDIFQLIEVDNVITSGKRGKEWSLILKKKKDNFSFITVICPFSSFDNRIDEDSTYSNIKGWKLNKTNGMSLTKDDKSIYFQVNTIQLDHINIEFEIAVDVFVNIKDESNIIQLLSKNEVSGVISKNNKNKNFKLVSGQQLKISKK